MKLKFCGGVRTVTGSNHLLQIGKKKILVDCGLFQGADRIEKMNYEPFPYNPAEIDIVLITHAHLDHIGRVPRLVNEGFRGRILATAPTIDFARLMLEDSQKILQEKQRKADVMPLVSEQHIGNVIDKFEAVEYDEFIQLGDGIRIRFRDAGHVLGSAIIEVISHGKKIVFTGDIGSGRMPLLRQPTVIQDADYIIIESTYGNRLHETMQTSVTAIKEIIERTIKQNGVLMIPSFALERTQKLLFHLNEMVENHQIPAIPVFVDSPLAIKLTEIYRRYRCYYSDKADDLIASGDDIFKFPGLKFTLTVRESKQINDVPAPKVIIAGSGMSQGGRIVHHETRYLPDPNNTLLIATYQAEETLGRKILEGAKEVEILDRPVKVRAKIEHLNGYSSHADQNELLNWLKNTADKSSGKIKGIFVCHGEEEPSLAFAEKVRSDLRLSAKVPKVGQVVQM